MRFIINVFVLLIGFFSSVMHKSFAEDSINTLSEKPIVIISASYNNSERYRWNLDSIFAQNYTNYRLIHWDDCSSDGSGDLVAAYVKECGQEHRTMVIKNKERRGACANEYSAAHVCRDDEIIVIVDGDDCLASPDVLKIINETYQDPNVWLTYGQNEYSSGGIGQCRELPVDCYVRHYSWVTSHLRTSYARLFKKIKLEDFMFDSRHLVTTCDLAQMFPMIDMAGNRTRFIPTVLYIYNVQTQQNDHVIDRGRQIDMEHFLRGKKAYQKLDVLFDESILNKATTEYDICSLCFNDIDSFKNNVENMRASSAQYVLVIDESSYGLCNINEHDIQRACRLMHTTGAYAFYFDQKHVEKCERVFDVLSNDNAVIAWQYGPNNIINSHQCGVLYRKDDFLNIVAASQVIENMQGQSSADIMRFWLEKAVNPEAVGLCFGDDTYQAIDVLID
jgi:glycosyltransferase involved in cell wall biosynthesis